jgi:NifB/MoaA-like Fe-S oxidoreductase
MVERYETDLVRRFQAGAEAVRLLEKAGFGVHDADVNVEDVADCIFTVEATLSVGEMTRPLKALEDEPDTDLGAGFALGLTAGLMAGNCGPCDRNDCPRGSE